MTADSPFAAALSEHPVAADAAGDVLGQVLERIEPEPDVAALFVSGVHAEHFSSIAATVRTLLSPGTLVGATAASVLGGAREVEGRPAVALWAGHVGHVTPVRLETVTTTAGTTMLGADGLAGRSGALLLLADAATFPLPAVTDAFAEQLPGIRLVGGASTGGEPASNRYALEDRILTDGAVGVLFGEDVQATPLVAQGCRPIGEPMVVTRAETSIIDRLAGQPALDRLLELLGGLGESERDLVRDGLYVGRVIDEHKDDFSPGDFLIGGVLGALRERSAVVLADPVEVGDVIQFQVREAAAADDQLRALLAGRHECAGLVFPSGHRGRDLFDESHHDATLISDAIGNGALAGMFCQGELGPAARRSWLHASSTSMLLFSR